MNGYKTSGDWTDVTSLSRNEVVFEGRHKEYGAFYLRQHYQKTLLLAMLSAITFIALCVLVPYALRSISHSKVIPVPEVTVRPIDFPTTNKKTVVVPPPPLSHPSVPPLKSPVQRTSLFLMSKTIPDSIDKKTMEHTVIASVGNPGTGTDATPDLSPATTGGSGGTAVVSKVDNKPFLSVQEMPKFPGGMEKYLADNLDYPTEERQNEVQGIVYASFVVERDGSVSSVTLLRGISNGPGLDREALRVLSAMPKWTPGKQDGHPVRVLYNIPIKFQLR